MIETDGLTKLIDDARHVPLPRQPEPRRGDVRVPQPRGEIRIPESSITLLEDYELYVG